MKILFVENNPLTLRSYTRLLQSRDHEVEGAEDIEQAQAKLAASSDFELALLDLELGGGVTTLAFATELAERGLRVIFHTGTYRTDLLNDASKLGLVIHKGPGSVDRLLEELSQE